MSKKQHNRASLFAWDGPYFPNNIQKLNAKLAEYPQPIDSEAIQVWCERIPNFVALQHPVEITSDGYRWYAAAYFKALIGQCRVLVLFPHFDDSSGIDGSKADRSVAVYTRAAPDPTFLEYIVQEILSNM